MKSISSVTRRARERKELQLQILDAASDLFARGGEEAVTLRAVADKIEYSATAIYSHFPSKGALMRELCDGELATLGRILQRAAQVADPLDRLRKVAIAYADFGLQYPPQYRLLFAHDLPAVQGQPDSENGAQAREAVGKYMHPHDCLKEVTFKAMAAGCFRPEYRSVEMIAQSIWSCLHGLVTLHAARARHEQVSWKPIHDLIEFTMEGLLNGLTLAAYQLPPTWTR